MGGSPTLPLHTPRSPQPSSRRRRAGAISDPFPQGSEVEVRVNNEEDFRDTYFSAAVISTVLVPSPKKGNKSKSKRIEVEYHSLFEEEDGSKRLREQVGVRCVRPSPSFREVVEGFEPGDAVDAYYQEGWWIGVVARVVEGEERRYAVTFQHPPDEVEFGVSELRVHWDWVKGSWVRPDRQSIAGLMFDVGRKVEVSFDQEKYQDAWFPGTIHQHLVNGTFLVECRGANSDVSNTEIVDSLHLRPWPPLFKYKNFVLLEKVDAFFDFGWWSGIIKQEFENSEYLVFFKELNMEKMFNQSQLRPHMDWKDGKWFTSSQDITNPSSDDGVHEHLAFENPSASVPTVPVNNSGDGKYPFGGKTSDQVDDSPGFQKTPHVTSLTKRKKHLSQKNVKEGNALGVNQQELHDISIKEMISGFVTPVSGKIANAIEKQSAPADHSSDNSPWVKRTRRMQRNVSAKINSLSNAKNSRAQKSRIENQELDVEGNEPDGVDYAAEEVQNEHTKKGFGVPIVIGLPCAEMESSGLRLPRLKRRSFNSKVIVKIGSEEKQQLDDSTPKNIEKRKRGRPRKTPIESIETAATDDLNEKDDNPHIIPEVEPIVTETLPAPNQEKTMTLNNDKPINGLSDTKDPIRTSTRKRREKVVEESTSPQENQVAKRGRRRSTVLQVRDLLGASGGKSMEVNSTLEVNIVCEAPSLEFENQPLSKWIQGMNTPSAVDVSKLSPVSAAEQPMENAEKNLTEIAVLDKFCEEHQASEVSTPAMVDKHSVVPIEPQNLPFVKNTTLWKTVETMEAFQKIPQNPHFQPLEHIKESLREGKAIGYMVTFASVVGKISELQFGDPKDVTDDIMEDLVELEPYGFNVRPIQDRVAELLAVKEKEVNLVGDVNELNDRILEHHQEKDKIGKEIDGIKEEIQKLEERLSVAESAKEKEEDELVVLADRLKETEESIENVRHAFEGIVSCPF